MFSKYHKARFTAASQKIFKGQKGADQRRCTLTFVYDFTTDLAQCMGKRAISMQESLAESKNDPLSAKDINLKLDTTTVKVAVKHKNSKVYEEEKTLAISAKAAAPTAASATNPNLTVNLVVLLSQGHTDFINEFLGEPMHVRLDRQQLEIEGTADQPQGE